MTGTWRAAEGRQLKSRGRRRAASYPPLWAKAIQPKVIVYRAPAPLIKCLVSLAEHPGHSDTND